MEDKASQPMPANQSSTTEGESSEVAPPSFIDPRVHFDKTSSKWQFEDYDGREYEWIESKQTWTPIIDESLWAAQQTAYSVDGVNENSPVPSNSKEEKKQLKLEKQLQKKNGSNNKNKRMRDQDNNQNVESSTSKGPPQRNTAIYVSRLPSDTNPEELKECFSRAGLILVDEENQPKIKLYKDESTGTFNGTALIVFYKSESVDLAIRLFDDASLRLGPSEQDRMQVSRAEFSHKKSTNDNDQQNESNNHSNSTDQQQQKKKKRVAKKVEKLKSKLEEWDSAGEEESNKQLTARFNKIVILKHMFTLAELQEDPTLLIDLKEDVREECELLGEVTNVTLYDLEPDGIMSVKFKEPIAAQACILKMNKRFFAGRQVSAFLYDGKYRYKKSGPGTTTNVSTNDTDNEIEEKKRLEEFAKYLEEEQ
ncbi:hypothetical protein Pst134EB_016186 [Puccinia striiformis f. sp. tritici]|uniref:RRM domain-containing protein n=1 Tax=Puccinia striiformis f. sp. tritici PST-78 TaxID=1165861 RepID=A0A0L0VF72_9BASI|nr:hypothetical protein Pst134EB_016186 [Puccinia striiformis f. sp. tritici]KNE97639.1 hypothetical protein PSTG_09046 [Puccinia striiformis f. sp. tritici PST-78]